MDDHPCTGCHWPQTSGASCDFQVQRARESQLQLQQNEAKVKEMQGQLAEAKRGWGKPWFLGDFMGF